MKASIDKLRKTSQKKKYQTGNTKVGVKLRRPLPKKKFTGGNDLSKKRDYFFIQAIYGSYLNNVVTRIKYTHGFRSSIPEIIKGCSMLDTPTPKTIQGIDRSLLVVCLSLFQVVPHGTKGTSPKFIMRSVHVKPYSGTTQHSLVGYK